MTAVGQTAMPGASAPGTPASAPPSEPVCLATGGGDVRAMLHPAAPGSARGTAVLLCPPFGWQEMCSYRGLRVWADALAGAGHTTARLDLPSTADSAGEPGDPDRLEAWTAAVTGTAAWLRESTGAARVVAIGIGLGGIVACRALATAAPIDDLVLWAVPGRGRALVREMRGYDQIIAAQFPEDDHTPADGTDELELIGYEMSAETVAALGELRLTSLEFPRGPRRVLMLGRDGITPDVKLAAHLREAGATVESADGGDFAELMANPQESVAPRRTIALTLDWLARAPACPASRAPDARANDEPTVDSAVAQRIEAVRCSYDGVRLRETPLFLEGVGGRIFAILCEPVTAPRGPLAAVFLGAGALSHTGPNRSWVTLSRRWAARGVPSVRVDLAGIGDADGEDPELLEDHSFYDPWRDAEVAIVLDQLQRRGVGSGFILGGLCSGAYRSLRRALIDSRVRGLLLLNLYAFSWSEELVLERGRRMAIASGVPNARGRSLDREFVVKALDYLRPDHAWRLLRRSAERSQKQAATAALERLCAGDVETLVLLAQAEPLLAQLERQRVVEKLAGWPNAVLERVPSRDHMYRAAWLRREVHAALDAAVDRAVARAGAR